MSFQPRSDAKSILRQGFLPPRKAWCHIAVVSFVFACYLPFNSFLFWGKLVWPFAPLECRAPNVAAYVLFPLFPIIAEVAYRFVHVAGPKDRVPGQLIATSLMFAADHFVMGNVGSSSVEEPALRLAYVAAAAGLTWCLSALLFARVAKVSQATSLLLTFPGVFLRMCVLTLNTPESQLARWRTGISCVERALFSLVMSASTLIPDSFVSPVLVHIAEGILTACEVWLQRAS